MFVAETREHLQDTGNEYEKASEECFNVGRSKVFVIKKDQSERERESCEKVRLEVTFLLVI